MSMVRCVQGKGSDCHMGRSLPFLVFGWCGRKLDREFLENLDELLVEWFVGADGF